MPHKNISVSIFRRVNGIPARCDAARLIMVGIVALAILFIPGGCKKIKAASGDRDALESLFEENILNRDFIVHLASDNGTDITGEFTGYNFVLTKTTSYYNGPMTGAKNGVTYDGTWACNDDFSKLTISFTGPSVPAEFNFINRSWKFTKKAFPIMELAPWGTTEPKILHMERL